MEMRAIGYVRRSKVSDSKTVSLEEQTEKITSYCNEKDLKLAEIVRDDGVSGGDRDRLERLEAVVRKHKAQAVVVYHLDRFARDVAALLDNLRAYRQRGVKLHVVGRGEIEVDTATGFLVTGVEGLMAEHYRRLIGEKTKDALARLKAKGRRFSRIAPYGYRVAEDGVHLEPDPKEEEVIEIILTGTGSVRRISRELAARGIVARNGRPFSPASLWRIVSNRPVRNIKVAI